MDIEKHLQFFANESNLFENARPISERPYFFPSASNDANDDSSLVKLETDQGITYDKMLTDLIAAQAAGSPGRLFALLRENGCIKKEVKKYVSRLITEWRANKDETEAVRLIDFHIVLKNIEAAQQILNEAAIDHDLLRVLDWAEKEKVEPSKANAIWGALCLSPISRAIARIYQCHLKDSDALQMQIAGHAEFINLQDAYVLASFWLGHKHPVTKSIYQKWMSNNTTRKVDESPSKQLPDVVDISNTAKDLIYSYRSHVCLLPINQTFRFSDSKTLHLRQLYIDAIMVRNWATADAIAADMGKRFTSSEYAQDTLALLSALSQIVATVLDRSNNQEDSQISQTVMKGGTMKDVVESVLLKNTIFARSFTEDDIDELDSVAGLVDGVLRSIRQAYRKSEHQTQHSVGEFVGLVLELTNCFAKLLLDFEAVVESIRPTFTTNEKLLAFFANDLGHQFKSEHQNERMKKLINSLHDGSKRSGSIEEVRKIEDIIEEEVPLKNEEAFQSTDLEDTPLLPVTPQPFSQIASEETVKEEKAGATAEVAPTTQMIEANIKDKVEPVPISQKPVMREENDSSDDGWGTSAVNEEQTFSPGGWSTEAKNSAPSFGKAFGSTDVGFPRPQLAEPDNNQGFHSSSRPQVGLNQAHPNDGGNQPHRYGFRNGRRAGDSFSSVRTRRPWNGNHGGASGFGADEGGEARN
ncbi:unnamed protein product, partial [Mesorhabditis belari]|uniref:Uncharacterized protein n=1 Tax=Mesorhabditis belari TaxID=2138241 RepID=A0AAF3FH83_9BILA